MGLRYAAETGEVEAISRTRPTAVLGAFRQRDYPAAWDQVSTETVEIAGLQAIPEGYRVGIAWGEAAPAAAQDLWEIFYKEGSSNRWYFSVVNFSSCRICSLLHWGRCG